MVVSASPKKTRDALKGLTSIKISLVVRKRLYEIGLKGETFSKIIERLLNEYQNKKS